MVDNFTTEFDGVIESDISDYAIKPGDRLTIESVYGDFVEGVAMFAVCYPYDSLIAIREANGNEIRVKGWLADNIEINGEAY